jgi:hypothetical protein
MMSRAELKNLETSRVDRLSSDASLGASGLPQDTWLSLRSDQDPTHGCNDRSGGGPDQFGVDTLKAAAVLRCC